jgi:hypothetical protein
MSLGCFLLVLFILAKTTKAQLILLNSILFSLSVAATNTFGGQSLVSKGSPGTEILATLAPLYFQPALHKDPNSNVACSTQTFVLARNNVTGIVNILGFLVFTLLLGTTKTTCRW